MLTKKAFLNFIATIVDQASRVTVQLLVTPTILSTLGENSFAYWQLLTRWMNQLIVLDGRASETLKWKIATRQSADITTKQKLVGAAVFTWLITFPLMVVIASHVFQDLPLWTKQSSADIDYFKTAGWFMLFNMLVLSSIALFEAVFRGMNIGYKRMGLLAGTTLFGGLASIVVLLSGGDIRHLAGTQFFITLIYLIIFLQVVRRNVPWLGIRWPENETIKEFMANNFWFTLWAFVSNGLFLGETILLGFFSSNSLVSSYAVTAFATQTIAVVISTAVLAILPGLGRVLEENNWRKMSDLRREATTYVGILVGSIGPVILLLNQSFVSLWVGVEQYSGVFENFLIVIAGIQLVYIRMDAALLNLAVNIRQKVLLGLASLALCTTLAYWLTPDYGIAGLCIAMIVGRLPMSLCLPMLVRRMIKATRDTGTKKRQGQIDDLMRWLWRAALFCVALYIGTLLHSASWIELIIYAITVSVLALGANYVLLARGDRQRLFDRVMKVTE